MATETTKISPERASKVLGISPNEIRYGLRTKTLPIGHARKAPGKKAFRYDIYKHLVMQYVGITEWPEGV